MNAFPSGIMLGYPSIDIGATLIGIRYSELTGTEFAFEACASLGLDDACRKASPILLEPIMTVDLLSPKEFVGDVISLVVQRGGIVQSMDFPPHDRSREGPGSHGQDVRFHDRPPLRQPRPRDLRDGVLPISRRRPKRISNGAGNEESRAGTQLVQKRIERRPAVFSRGLRRLFRLGRRRGPEVQFQFRHLQLFVSVLCRL